METEADGLTKLKCKVAKESVSLFTQSHTHTNRHVGGGFKDLITDIAVMLLCTMHAEKRLKVEGRNVNEPGSGTTISISSGRRAGMR